MAPQPYIPAPETITPGMLGVMSVEQYKALFALQTPEVAEQFRRLRKKEVACILAKRSRLRDKQLRIEKRAVARGEASPVPRTGRRATAVER